MVDEEKVVSPATIKNNIKYETLKQIGDGMHAKIYLARKCEDSLMPGEVQLPVCLKIFKTLADEDVEDVGKPENEYKFSQIFRDNENFVQIHSFLEQAPVIIDGKEERRDYLVMEYCENGDLIDFLLKYVNK